MLRLKCTVVNKPGACMPNYFSCYSSTTLYSINHLLFTKLGLFGMVGYHYMFLILKYLPEFE